MNKLSLLGTIVGAALLSATPLSIQPSPNGLVELSLNKADAQDGVYRRTYRRAYPSAYRRDYYVRDYPAQYYGVYPNYGLYPTNYGYGYRVLPWWW
jgi:hypothetical protein